MEKFLADREVSEIVEFWRRYGYYDVSTEVLREIITKHLLYTTLEVIKNPEIIAICRYNINGKEVEILDCVIHPNYRKKRLLKLMIINGLKKYPQTRTITYKRGLKDTKIRRYGLMKFLGVR